jgi:hypothetical protein
MNGMLPGAMPVQALEPNPLFEEIRKSALERLGLAHEAVMRQTDDYLFDRSSNNADGAELTALRDLRRARAQLWRTFERSLEASFTALLQEPEATATKRVLNLLSEDALEEQLASEQMVDGLLRRHAASLELLDQRFAALVDRSVLAAGSNPIGPAALAKAMRESLASVELSTGLRIAMYKFMERELATALTPLYDRVNARLGEAGILPRLLPIAPTVRETPQAEAICVAADSDYGASAAGEATAQDQALFSSLIGMLQSWRHQVMPGAATRGSGAQLAVPELMSALSLLQRETPEMLEQAVGDGGMSLGDLLRREVLAGARRLGMGGEDLNLSTIQEDAVDLVGMLFDVLLDERDFEPGIRRKIGRMLVPFVKVAVKDRRMFVYKRHPARRFLNAVAEACEGNRGDAPQEKELLDHVDASIDRLVAEFNEDVAIFEVLEQELRGFMTQQRLRVEIAERRAAETQRGRERLEAARIRAAGDIGVRLSTRQLPAVLEQLLSGYAVHHLSQLALRGGADDAYSGVLAMLDAMLHVFDQAARGASEPFELDRSGLLEMLASSGCVDAPAEAAIVAIQRSLSQITMVGAPDIALPEPAVPSAAAAAPVLEVVGGRDLLDYEPDVAERMRALTVDTWVQLTGESGRAEPAKISWISPISSRFLFVNRRGARVLVASAEELAAMEKAGRLQVRPSGSAFDNALQQIVGKLQTKMAA